MCQTHFYKIQVGCHIHKVKRVLQFSLLIYVLLTSQSVGLPTVAVEVQRAIKGLAPATKTKRIHLRPQRDRMRATYSNPKPNHMNSRKNGSVRELRRAVWSAPPLNYSEKPPLHLWRRVFLHALMSCCGWIVSSFTLSPFSCRNWHCFIVLLIPNPLLFGGWGRRALSALLPVTRWTVRYRQVTQGWPSSRISRRITPRLSLPFPLPISLRPCTALCLRMDC